MRVLPDDSPSVCVRSQHSLAGMLGRTGMSILSITVLTLCSFVMPANATYSPDDIEGLWLTNEGTFKVVIAPCNEDAAPRSGNASDDSDQATEYCGTIVWARPFTEEEKAKYEEDGESFDTKNAIGSEVLRNFTHAGGNEWKSGKFYVEARDKTYSTTLELVSPDELDVNIRVALVFGKTVRWTRIDEDSLDPLLGREPD